MESLSSKDTGVELVKLKGQTNYMPWARDFQIVAELKGVWHMIVKPFPEPTRPKADKYFEPRVVPPTPDNDGDFKVKDESFDPKEYSAQQSEYKLALAQYQEDEKLYRTAKALIAFWVDASLRIAVQRFKTPNEAWEYLKVMYRLSDRRRLDIAQAKLDKLTIQQCSDAQDYINRIFALGFELEDAGVTLEDDQMLSKLIRGLVDDKDYKDFVHQYYFLMDSKVLENVSFNTMTARLITYASTYVKKNGSNNNKNAKVDQDEAFNVRREKCTVPDCQKWGHSAENCWVTHPEKKKEHEEKKKARAEARAETRARKQQQGSNASNSKDSDNSNNNQRRRIVAVANQDSNSTQDKKVVAMVFGAIDESSGDHHPPSRPEPLTQTNTNEIGESEMSTNTNEIGESEISTNANAIATKPSSFLKQLDQVNCSINILGWRVTRTHCNLLKFDKIHTNTPHVFHGKRELPPVKADTPSLETISHLEELVIKRIQQLEDAVLEEWYELVLWEDQVVHFSCGHNHVDQGTASSAIAQRLDEIHGIVGHPDFGKFDRQSNHQDASNGTPQHNPDVHMEGRCEGEDLQELGRDTKILNPRVDMLGEDEALPTSYEQEEMNMDGRIPGADLQELGHWGEGIDDEEEAFLLRCKEPVNQHAFFLAQDAGEKHDDWISDSGANIHICNNRKWFTQLRSHKSQVQTADDEGVMKVLGRGTVTLRVVYNGEETELVIGNVAYCPSLRCNIISVSSLYNDAGIQTGPFGSHANLVTSTGLVFAQAYLENGLYLLEATPALEAAASLVKALGEEKDFVPQSFASSLIATQFTANINFSDPVWMEHRRLGHLSFERMIKLCDSSVGMKVTKKQIRAKHGAICPVCAISRAINRVPREPARRAFQNIGDLVYVDTWGKYSKPSIEGFKYFMHFTDDSRRYTWFHGFKSKTEIPELFKKLHKTIERTHNATIRRYRFDNEFKVVQKWLEELGVSCEVAAPYAHHQNGAQERRHRVDREQAATMIAEHKLPNHIKRILDQDENELLRNTTLPESLWSYAWRHAIWQRNRSPSRALKSKKTPWEGVHGVAPDLSHELVWGSRCYVTSPVELRTTKTKLHHDRGWLGYFVGFYSESTYYIYNPDKNQVFKIAIARCENGEGLDDTQDEPNDLQTEAEQQMIEINEQDSIDANDDDDDSSIPSSSDSEDEAGTPEENDQPRSQSPDSEPVPEPSIEVPEDHVPDFTSYRETSVIPDDDNSDDSSDDGAPMRSRFFANMASHEGWFAENEEVDDMYVPPLGSDIEENPVVGGRCMYFGCDYDGLQWNLQRAPTGVKGQSDATLRRRRRKHYDEAHNGPIIIVTPDMKFVKLSCSQCTDVPNEPQSKLVEHMKKAHGLKLNSVEFDSAYCHSAPPSHKGYRGMASLVDFFNLCTKTEISHEEALEAINSKGRVLGPNWAVKRLLNIGHRDKICAPCVRHGRDDCDGTEPCGNCEAESLDCHKRLGVVDTHACRPCRDRINLVLADKEHYLPCDHETPCQECQKRGIECSYPNNVRKRFKCVHCTNQNLKCDGTGTGPCSACLRQSKDPNFRRKSCSYTFEADDGSFLSKHFYLFRREFDPLLQGLNCGQCIRYYTQSRSHSRPEGNCNGELPCQNCTIPRTHVSINYSKASGCTYQLSEWEGKRYLPKRPKNPMSDRQQSTVAAAQGGNSDDDFDETLADDEEIFLGLDDLGIRLNDAGDFEIIREPEMSEELVEELEQAEQDGLPLAGQLGTDDDIGFVAMIRSSDLMFDANDEDEAPVQPMAGLALLARSINLDEEPKNRQQALERPDAPFWKIAMQDEYDSLLEHQTWTLVPRPRHAKVLTGRWVFKRKIGADGQITRYKARFVVRGFEQIYGINYEETYAPVVKSGTYKLFFALIAHLGWLSCQVDVVTAFLNGEVEEEIYVEPPEGYECEGYVLLLVKGLYGLKQAPRQWYRRLKDYLEASGWTVSSVDPSVFFHREKQLFLTVYVDDFNIIGEHKEVIDVFVKELNTEFSITDLGETSYYLGMHVHKLSDGSVFVHQATYVKRLLEKYSLQDIIPASTPFLSNFKFTENKGKKGTKDFIACYQSKVGSLIYLVTVCRLELAYITGMLGRYTSNPSPDHMKAADRVYAFLAGTMDRGILFAAGQDNNLSGYVDSDWAGCQDTRRSTTGYLFTLGNGPISWASRRQKTPALSTCEAEYMAATEAAKEALWLQHLFEEVGVPNLTKETEVPLHIDNSSAIKLSKNPELHRDTKHIELRHHFIREQVQSHKIELVKIDTEDNLADLFTKPLTQARFETLLRKAGMRDLGDIVEQ